MDSLEALVSEAHKAKGWAWVQSEPLWCTWTLEKFGTFTNTQICFSLTRCKATRMPDLLPPYHRSLYLHAELVNSLRSHSITFEESKSILAKWDSQPHLEADEWVQEWEDLCEVEVDKWYGK